MEKKVKTEQVKMSQCSSSYREPPVFFFEKAFLEFLQASGNFQGSKEIYFDNFSNVLIASVKE